MMTQYADTIRLLEDSLNSCKVNKVSKQIQKKSDDPLFCQLLKNAILDDQLLYNVRLTAAIILSNIIKKQCYNWEQDLIYQIIFDIMLAQNINIRVKSNFQQPLISMLQFSNKSYFIYCIQKLKSVLQKIIIAKNNQYVDKITINQSSITALLLFRSIVNSKAYPQQLLKHLQQYLLDVLLQLGKYNNFYDVEVYSSVSENITSLIQVLRLKQTSFEHLSLLKWLVSNMKLLEWNFTLYMIDMRNQNHYWINLSPQIDHQQMSKLKINATRIHIQLLKAADFLSLTAQLQTKHLSIFNCILNTLTIYQHSYQACQPYEQFVTSLVSLLVLLGKIYPILFIQQYVRIIHLSIFPLLNATQQQNQLFLDDPKQYKQLLQNCCSNQSFGILKTQISRLLESICDSVQEAARYVIQHCAISLRLRLSEKHNMANIANYLQIQTSILVLTILSNNLSGKINQILQIKSLILPAHKILNKLNKKNLGTMFLFLSFNYQQITQNVNQIQDWIFLALQYEISQYQTCPSLALLALDFIFNISNTFFSQSMILQISNRLLNIQQNFQQRLACLSKAISNFCHLYCQKTLTKLLQNFLDAIDIQLTKISKRQKQSYQQIIQIIHIFTRIVNKSQAYKLPLVRTGILACAGKLQQLYKINQDDQIIKLLIIIIKKYGLSDEIKNGMARVYNLYQLNRQDHTIYLVFFHQFFMHYFDHSYFQIIYSMINGAKVLWSNIKMSPTCLSDRIVLASYFTVFQNILFKHGDKFDKNTIDSFVSLADNIIGDSNQPQTSTPQPLLIGRSLILMFQCHMFITNQHALNRILQFRQHQNIFRGYDLKVLASLYQIQIFRQSDIISITQMIITLARFIMKQRIKSTKVQIKSKKQNKISNPTVIKIKKVADFQAIVKNITHVFNSQLQAQSILINILQKMKNNNNNLYVSIMNSIPSMFSSQLRQLVSQIDIEGKKRRLYHVGSMKQGNIDKRQLQPIIRKRNEDQNEIESNSDSQQLDKNKIKKQKKIKEMV